MTRQITPLIIYRRPGRLLVLGLILSGVLGLGLAGLAAAAGPVGTVAAHTKIADDLGGLPPGTLADQDVFGISTTAAGDLNQDGVPDLAVGAGGDDTGGDRRGAIYLLSLKPDNTVLSSTKIADGLGGLPANTLSNGDNFGWSVTTVGDLNQDGTPDLAVGAPLDDTGERDSGAVYVLLMKPDNTVLTYTKIANGLGGLPANTLTGEDRFGSEATAIGDWNQDGVPDLAVGAPDDNTGGSSISDRGAIHLFLLKADGAVLSHTKIADGLGGLPANTLTDQNLFGSAITPVGDLNQDGAPDLAVGARGDNAPGGFFNGAVFLLLLQPDRTVLSYTKITNGLGGLPPGTLANNDNFGGAMTTVGDLDQNGVVDLAVGAFSDNTGGAGDNNRGAVYLLLMNSNRTVRSFIKIADGLGGLPAGTLAQRDQFGFEVTAGGDLNQDGVPDLVVGAPGDDTGGNGRGSIYLLFLNGTALNLTKSVDDTRPQPGQRITYTLSVANSGTLTATNAVLTDPLPEGLTFAGPISLTPPGAGTPGTSPPGLAGDLTIGPGQTVAVSFPVVVDPTLTGGTLIANTAAVTSVEAAVPVTATVSLTIGGRQIYLPAVLKSS